MRSRLTAIIPLLWLLSSTRVAAQAEAAGPAATEATTALERNTEAVAEGQAALEAFQLEQWDLAYRRFRRAESVAHSPVFVLYMARAKRQLGKLLEAAELYALVTREPLTHASPEAWRNAVATASTEQNELRARLPSIILAFASTEPQDAQVTLDGVAVTQLGRELALDPGTHVLVVSRGAAQARRYVTVREAEQRIHIALTVPGGAVASGVRATDRAVRPPSPRRATTSRPTPTEDSTAAYVVGAVGLTSLLVTLVTGALAWSEMQHLKARCDGTRCAPEDAPKRDTIRRLATAADVSFVLGITGVGLSASLLWALPGSDDSAKVRGLSVTARY